MSDRMAKILAYTIVSIFIMVCITILFSVIIIGLESIVGLYYGFNVVDLIQLIIVSLILLWIFKTK